MSLSISIGARLGHYEILSLLGSGGMGDVYRARDTRPALAREVAIKVLRDEGLDGASQGRLAQEARATSALNHPNVLAIFDVGTHDGSLYLVEELVDGVTLRDLLGKGPLSSRKAVDYARAIAQGLAAAHGKAIIHRDLKPENVMIAGDGRVKILDFGLAKLHQPVPTSDSSTRTHQTGPGTVLGTVAYMSPEQVRGQALDHRSDLFSLGVVFYEMLCGRRPFEGGTAPDTQAAILGAEPHELPAAQAIPATVERVVRRCLEKTPELRFQSASDLAFALEGVSSGSTASGEAIATLGQKTARPVAALSGWVLSGLLATGLALLLMRGTPNGSALSEVSRFAIDSQGSPYFPGNGIDLALSPDGRTLVFRAQDDPGKPTTSRFMSRNLSQESPAPVQGVSAVNNPFFSPDGRWLGYRDNDSNLRRVAVDGGASQIVCAVDGQLRGATWLDDDTIVFATSRSKGLMRVQAAGGTPSQLTKVDLARGEVDHFFPDALPNGKGVTFTADYGATAVPRLEAVALDGTAPRELGLAGSSSRYSSTRHLVFAADGSLRAVRFDPERLAILGTATPLPEKVAVDTLTRAAHFSISKDGALVHVTGMVGTGPRTLVWVDRTGREEPIQVEPRSYTYARLSPDNTQVALDSRDGQRDIWILHLLRRTLTRLTTGPEFDRVPIWSRDGKRIAFSSDRDGRSAIFWQNADASGQAQRLTDKEVERAPSSFMPNSRQLLFSTPVQSNPFDLGLLFLDGSRPPEMLLDSDSDELNGDISPDGRWLVYEDSTSGHAEIYVRSFPKVRDFVRQVSTSGGTRPVWRSDGREVFYYVSPDTIMAASVTRTGNEIDFATPQVVVKRPFAIARNAGRHYDVSSDGNRFLLLKEARASGEQTPERPRINYVQHFDEELKRLLPD